MPTIRKLTTKNGDRDFYEIKVSRGRKKAPLTTRWYPPTGWSRKAIERELNKVAAEFERKVNEGEIVSRAEQREAEEKAAQEAAAIMTVERYGKEIFLPTKRLTLTPNSYDSFERNLRLYLYPAIGSKKITEVVPADVSAIILKMQKEGKAHASCVKFYTIVNLLFKMAFMSDIIEHNPLDKVERPKPTKDEKAKRADVEAFTKDELLYILNCLKKEPLKWQVYVSLLANTGCRRGEISALQWSDINFDTGEVNISKSLSYTKAEGNHIGTPKNGKSRIVYADNSSLDLLRKLRFEQATTHMSKYIFTQDNSAEPWHAQTPTKYFADFGNKYNVEGFHPHKLRHTFASLAITAGADIASISEILGHSDKAVTLRVYSHADEESRKRAAQVFRNVLAGEI